MVDTVRMRFPRCVAMWTDHIRNLEITPALIVSRFPKEFQFGSFRPEPCPLLHHRRRRANRKGRRRRRNLKNQLANSRAPSRQLRAFSCVLQENQADGCVLWLDEMHRDGYIDERHH